MEGFTSGTTPFHIGICLPLRGPPSFTNVYWIRYWVSNSMATPTVVLTASLSITLSCLRSQGIPLGTSKDYAGYWHKTRTEIWWSGSLLEGALLGPAYYCPFHTCFQNHTCAWITRTVVLHWAQALHPRKQRSLPPPLSQPLNASHSVPKFTWGDVLNYVREVSNKQVAKGIGEKMPLVKKKKKTHYLS